MEGSRELAAAETRRGEVQSSRFYPGFHVAPPVGWLNDPNGLCQYRGMYHAFFQYAPASAAGGLKFWGHSVSRDLLHWRYAGAALAPDREFDRDGVYSGCALAEEDRLRLYYTGNVRLPGDFDYIHNGREANVIMVEAAVPETGKAGKPESAEAMRSGEELEFGEKRPLLGTADYPAGMTRHIRDPKVWKENGSYYMVLGGRTETDEGCVLVYRSADGVSWDYEGQIGSREPFGYMWECPDLFRLPETGERVLSVSPQGLARETHRCQNIYASGYFLLPEEAFPPAGSGQESSRDCLGCPDCLGRPICPGRQDCPGCLSGTAGGRKTAQNLLLPLDPAQFREWDQGFDFYAPQTFEDEKGRRLLMAWMGLPDVEAEYTVPTVREGWQHILTVPRQITARNGRLYSYPVKETESLHQEAMPVSRRKSETFPAGREGSQTAGQTEPLPFPERAQLFEIEGNGKAYDLFLTGLNTEKSPLHLTLAEGLHFTFANREAVLTFTGEAGQKLGCGRGTRRARLEKLTGVRVLADASSLEIFLNEGEFSFTTRYFPADDAIRITAQGLIGEARCYRC